VRTDLRSIALSYLRGFWLLLVASLLIAATVTAHAQNYPTRPIRVIDAYPPGGTTDVVARMISVKFAESTGYSWVVDARPGAQGIIGTALAAKATPDGYTLLMFTGSHAIHPSVYQNLPYDLLKDFAPVTLTSNTTNVLIVHASSPAKTVKDVIAMAKAKPGVLTYASAGHGSTNHVHMELFNSMAGGLKMTHVPYKGSAPAVLDVIGGQINLMFAPLPVVVGHVKAGKIRAIAVSTAKRSVAMPELPTVSEAALPGYEAANSVGVLAPAKTPRDIVRKLNAEIARALNLPDVRERLLAIGAEPVANSPEEFAAVLRADLAKWAKVVKESGMTLVPW